MTNELDLYGVYVPGLLVVMLASLVVTSIVRRALAWCGVYAFVWHRGLFDIALYVVLLGAVSTLARSSLS